MDLYGEILEKLLLAHEYTSKKLKSGKHTVELIDYVAEKEDVNGDPLPISLDEICPDDKFDVVVELKYWGRFGTVRVSIKLKDCEPTITSKKDEEVLDYAILDQERNMIRGVIVSDIDSQNSIATWKASISMLVRKALRDLIKLICMSHS